MLCCPTHSDLTSAQSEWVQMNNRSDFTVCEANLPQGEFKSSEPIFDVLDAGYHSQKPEVKLGISRSRATNDLEG